MERGEDMASALWGKFASEVLKEVGFKYDHNAIRQELVEHMEELYEDLQAEGMDAHVAEVMAVEYMGDAAEIGKALNEEHSPLLGWVWRVSRWMVMAVFVVCMAWYGGGTIKAVAESVFAEYKGRVVSPLVYTMEVDQTVEWYDAKLHFDEILYYEDEVLEIRFSYLNWNEKWNPSGGNDITRFQLNFAYEDAEEKVIMKDSYGEVENKLGSGVYYKNQIFIKNFPEDVKKLYIGYDKSGCDYIEIDLSEGGER